ncbi:nucleotidyltransferase family protein [Candidatus Tokpelaia sp.]|uniref:nucleotidyltransferase family protein n=1 Tax=Candidatus Tokpelaia sp. TaxID=2233777 RepID=UPI0012389009|nr:nucleotidyltransferase domain-containing protein [Candidatus Tokpelaia sp.]KAA6405077.1 nucleotidyltransferase domain-containing protein [Candidatus Tokpelaia sp.]
MPKKSPEAAVARDRRLAVRPEHRLIICAVLRAVLPEEAAVYVFGSRAGGTLKKAADLDLAIDAGRKLTLQEEIALSEKFEDSDLPYKVDIVDLCAVSAAFAKIIRTHNILLR